MKRKRNQTSRSAGAARDKVPIATNAPISLRRRWCFRLIALMSPLLVLGLLELGLRLAGFGYPTAFLLKANDNGRAMLASNLKFGWRFFPPAIARAPRPLYFAAQKPTDTVRIFVFGESAAMGDPEPAYGFARQLERILQARHPDRKIEVINAGMTAINSHVIREIARDCAPREGDFWLVYAGNNEVIGPFGAGTIFGPQAPNRATVRTILALDRTRVGQLLAQTTRSANEPKEWQGLEFFLKSRVADNSPVLQRVYDSFAANLNDIADFGRRSGATVLLSTVPVNLRDFPPFASLHRPALRPEQLAEWQKLFSAGTQAQAAGDYTNAVSAFRKAGEIDDDFAELVFQRAACEVELKQAAAAETDFRRACDLDTLRFRADSSINKIIRQTAKAKDLSLTDTDGEFARDLSENLFYDHVHLNFSGNYHVALLFAAEIEKHWTGGPTNQSPWLTEAEVAQRLAWTGFDERRVGEEMRARLQQPPFSAQSNFRARDERWQTLLTALSAAPATCITNYNAAVTLAPDDWQLRAKFAWLLEACGNNDGAARQWTEVSRLLPHSTEGWANLGRLARTAGDAGSANHFLQEALKQQPESVEARTEFGILEASRGNIENARQQFLSVLRLQPGFTAARVNLGLLLAGQGDVVGATAEYREAVRWHTNSVEARINLANLMVAHGQSGEALTLYEQAVALEPENPIARYNLGRLLATQNRLAEAVTNFQVALQQRPDLGEIHFELGNALGQLRKDAEALGEFAQAVRLKPDFADAHLNYGVALARSGRLPEAAAEFRETLRLNPQDQRAQLMLDRATHSSGRAGKSP